MPENKKPVKQVSVYDGTDWDTYDIGANAENITLSSIGVGSNVQTAFDSLIGSNSLGSRQAVITDSQGRITTGNISASSLEGLENIVITDDAGAPTEDVEFVSGDTTLIPASTESVSLLTSNDSWSTRLNKISLMFKNIRYLLNKIGNTDLSSLEGDGTITGSINALDTKVNRLLKFYSVTTPVYTISANSGIRVEASLVLPDNYAGVISLRQISTNHSVAVSLNTFGVDGDGTAGSTVTLYAWFRNATSTAFTDFTATF